MTAGLWLKMHEELQETFTLQCVPLALLDKIQGAPCQELRGCVETYRRSCGKEMHTRRWASGKAGASP